MSLNITLDSLLNGGSPTATENIYSQKLVATVSTKPEAPTDTASQLGRLLMSEQGLILLGCAVGLAALSFINGGEVKTGTTKKNAKAKGKWAGKKELTAARKLAIKQLNGRSRKSACVWIIRPKVLEYPDEVVTIKTYKKSGKKLRQAPGIGAIPKEKPVKVQGEKHRFHSDFENKTVSAETIWIPDTQRSVMVVGAPGSGKTFSAIDPMIRSVVEQGHPLVLYDFKYPTQTSTVAWYAEQMGYQIRVFAPGFPESDVLNLLDFLTGDPQNDASLARQLANTMNKNFRIGQTGGGDPFFDSAGDQLVQAVMMLTRQMKHYDVLMTSVILSFPQLIERLYPESSNIDPWIRQAFGQIFSVKDSEKTVSSIIGTASLNFGKLVMPDILAACMGETTLPLDIEGKQMIVFGLNRELRDVMGPIVATAINMLVNRNLFVKGGRKTPLYTVLDELPTIFLPQLVNWENESRSDGFNGIIGFQNKSQLKKIYGEEMALAIMGGCATKFIFNPGEVESAEYFSKFFGDEEVARKNQSRNIGKGGGGSKSVEVYTRKLVSPEEFICLPPGTCYMTNPAYSNDEMSYLPRRIKVNLPPHELELAGQIESNWEKVRAKLIKRTENTRRVPTQEDIKIRIEEFEARFPVPKDDQQQQAPDMISTLASML